LAGISIVASTKTGRQNIAPRCNDVSTLELKELWVVCIYVDIVLLRSRAIFQ
jgi:hypothetical protein